MNSAFICTFLVIQCFSSLVLGQDFKGRVERSLMPVLGPHFEPEHTFDKPVNIKAWQNQQGMQVSFGSTDQLYFRAEVPLSGNRSLAQTITVWKGERVNAQMLVWSADTLEQVRFELGNFKNAKGDVLNKQIFQLNMVRYVLSNYPYGAKDVVCGESPYKDGFLMPDRFEKFDRFEVPGNTTRPVWLSADIPASTAPGTYIGTIQVKSDKQTATMQLSIKVQDQVLPAPGEWKHRLDLWQNPWVIAQYYQLEPWSAEHKALLKQHMKMYADAGGKYITTYAVHSPWSDNSYMVEGGMIDWVKQRDGSWKFDYKIFDEYVSLAMELGIDKAITIYTPIPWGSRFRYKDEATGNYVYETWNPDSEKFKKHFPAFLADLQKHLQRKGWLEKTYLGINENELKQTLTAIRVIKAHSSKWRITYAGDWHKELDTLLDDYSFLYGKEPSMEEAKARKARGASSTFYVCCNPAKPNNFVFSPPIEGRWISWYSAAYGYDGFLRWAYDAWTSDPVRDARHGSWAAGDCYLVYPGANSCIRFEKMREGIVDFEKINILKDKAARSTNNNVQKLLKAFEAHLKVFTLERDFEESKILHDVNKGKAMMEELSEAL